MSIILFDVLKVEERARKPRQHFTTDRKLKNRQKEEDVGKRNRKIESAFRLRKGNILVA